MNFFKKLFGTKNKPLSIETKLEDELIALQTMPDISNTPCPYCNLLMDKMPTRKKKCPGCGQAIFVKRRVGNEIQVLVTEEEANEIDKEWELHYLDKKYLERFEKFGLSEDQYQQRKKDFPRKLNTKSSYRDFLWATYNYILSINATSFVNQQMIYFEMGLFLNEEGKDSSKMMQARAKAELHGYHQVGVKKVEILTSGQQSCMNCQKLEGKVFTIKEALEKMPLPCKDCTSSYGYCRCCYVVPE